MGIFSQCNRTLKRSLLGGLIKTTSQGSNILSWKLRPFFEDARSKLFVILPLTGLTFASAIGIPQLSNYITRSNVENAVIYTVLEVFPSGTSYQWPLKRFGISQNYSPYHPGLDMTAPQGTQINPVREGIVESVEILPDGYGQHVVIKHENGTRSLYAHLSKIDVYPKEEVSKSTEIGEVGSTGHSTGNHLHLEIYEKGHTLNPFDVLPEVKKESLTSPVIPAASPSGQKPESLLQ